MGELENLCEPQYSKRANPTPPSLPTHVCLVYMKIRFEQALAKKTEVKLKGYCVSCRQTLLAQVRQLAVLPTLFHQMQRALTCLERKKYKKIHQREFCFLGDNNKRYDSRLKENVHLLTIQGHLLTHSIRNIATFPKHVVNPVQVFCRVFCRETSMKEQKTDLQQTIVLVFCTIKITYLCRPRLQPFFLLRASWYSQVWVRLLGDKNSALVHLIVGLRTS